MIYIDSAFYHIAEFPVSYFKEVIDKTLILADIYEEQQDYEKSIQRLENLHTMRIPGTGLPSSMLAKGYATYRLTQLYEKNGEIDKALAKCDLFLKNYKDCDEKYRPWWNEVAERRQRLINKLN